METSQGSQALAWSGWIREAQWPVTPRGKALALACLGATVVPPPAHGLAQRVPKWLDFLPPHPPPRSPTTIPREPGRPLAELALSPAGLPKPVLPTPWSRISPQGSRRGDPPIPLGLFGACRPHPHSFCCTLRPQLLGCNNRALGMGCCFCSWAGAEQQGEGFAGTKHLRKPRAHIPTRAVTALQTSNCTVPTREAPGQGSECGGKAEKEASQRGVRA